MPHSPILQRHLLRMRLTAVGFLASLPVAVVAAFFLPRVGMPHVSPHAVTFVCLGVSLWIAFTADRAARRAMVRIHDAFSVHGEQSRLLRDHYRVYLGVLLRLEVITLCGLATAMAGTGPRTTLWFLVVVSILMALAWPTEGKTRLLLRRAEGAPTHPASQ
jgi:hypothetical protein